MYRALSVLIPYDRAAGLVRRLPSKYHDGDHGRPIAVAILFALDLAGFEDDPEAEARPADEIELARGDPSLPEHAILDGAHNTVAVVGVLRHAANAVALLYSSKKKSSRTTVA